MLLAVIGVLSGAWLGADLLKGGAKRAARAATRPKPEPAVAGTKGGSLALPLAAAVPARKPRVASADTKPAEDKPVSAPGAQESHSDIRQVHGPFGYLMELGKRFGADLCPAWAASLSFFSILSIPPVLLCGLAVLGALIKPAEAEQQVQRVLANVLPGGGRAAERQAAQIMKQLNVEKSIETLHEQRGVAGVVGVVSLFWAAMQIFINATTPMNAAFRAKETRGWFKLRGYALFLLFVAGALFLLSLLPSAGASVIRRIPWFSNLPDPVPPIIAFLILLVGVAINATMFAVIYRYLPSPSAGIEWREAFFAGAIVAVLWEAAKIGFAFYLSRFGNYDKVYGSLGGAVALVFWIYYSSLILLLGAEIAKLYSDVREAKRNPAPA
uniref:YihY/virulence factor BrkB family protein n=1 Tax=uncultured Armatimonadetes bacterium TaxID=157466 RepID=A0A6J4IVZ3_9BACT|nr:hypothetical protein AVDCRST_MAG63-3194 [uncultured Armatimonadetes bacterium]